ncbi:hypothetical protein WUBG_04570 [Wuchereria bancrofti]|uniref:Uncharacterized protein n=1 Tax=Wuchereria bancrofti TaxID=6293 RepID=J9F4W1_WUCBA|nr:hypothetical protein WUBG_04570 [Wuchereria bancrofti]
MMEEMDRALDATDQFLDTVLQNKSRLEDPNFMMHLMRIRQKHKKTFAVIDEVYDLCHSSKSVASIHTDVINQQCCGTVYNFLSNKYLQISRNHSKSINNFMEYAVG